MNVLLRRCFFLSHQDHPDIEDLYETLSEELRAYLQAWMGPAERIADWPTVERIDGNAAIRAIESSEWIAGEENARLLSLSFAQHTGELDWQVEVALAQSQPDQVILYVELGLPAYRPTVPLHTRPRPLGFLNRYQAKDEDGMAAGRIYVVSKARVPEFVEFIRSPQRRLPVLLISPDPESGQPLMRQSREIAREVRGIAHVVRFETHEAAMQFQSLLPRHTCYNGAVRILWPGLKPDDDWLAHRLWMPSKVRGPIASRQACAEILQLLLTESIHLIPENPDIRSMRQQRERQLTKPAVSTKDWDALYLEYERAAKEVDLLRQLNQKLEQENRSLRWQLTTAWQKGDVAVEEESGPSLLLSADARQRYERLDGKEQDYWERHLFAKLLDAELCDAQSEPIEGPNGTCWVYPRGGTAGGRRVIYYRDGEDVCICELFASHENYDRFRSAHRETGIDRERYGGFEEHALPESYLREEVTDYEAFQGVPTQTCPH